MDGFYFALTANLLFSFSSFFIAKFTIKYGTIWTNTFKNLIAVLCFLLSSVLINYQGFPDLQTSYYLFLSGIIGLAIGDIFILNAFSKLGSTRVIVLYGLTPFFVAIIRFVVFKKELLISELVPVLFFSICLLCFARERKKLLGVWDIRSLAIGACGVFFDAIGVVLTRVAFQASPNLSSFHANTIRGIGSLVIMFIILKYKNISFFKPIINIKKQTKDLMTLFMVPITGTFLSLLFYLQAIKVGNLVIITALGVSGPILSSLIESYAEKKWPSWYLVVAILCFSLGVLAKVYLL